jgi:LysM repeat protein
MRSVFILSLSAALLSGCLTTQENPNYEHSTVYKADGAEPSQYAHAEPVAGTAVSYQQAAPVQTQTVSIQSMPAQVSPTHTTATAATVLATAPTDALYGSREVSGTPGFMAMESARQAGALDATTQALPNAEVVRAAPLGAMGTPITYDYSRNMVATDAAFAGQQMSETVRVLPQATGQAYTVQQGDTVYSLARKTCVGVSVIQSMNGLNTDYAIKIGQTLTLPASVC